MEIYKSLLHNIIKDNTKISLLFEDIFEGILKELFIIIKKLYYQDNLVSFYTLEYYLVNNASKYLAILNSIQNCNSGITFQEAYVLAIKEYNKRVFKDLFKKDVSSDIELYELVSEALYKFRKVDTFNLDEHIDKTIHNLICEENSKYPIGIKEIDSCIDISPDRFITIGGASGSGKTAFTIFLIDRLCSLYEDSIDVLFLSLEMSEERIINRLLSLYAEETTREIRKKLKSNDEHMLNKVLDFKNKIKRYPLEILYTELDIHKIDVILQSHINKAKSRNKTPVLFLDHFGEVVGLDEYSSKTNTDKITMAMKNYVKKGSIGFGLTQLRKDLKDKKNKEIYYKPSNSYIMNSQSVEARSDMILHLWRPEQDGFQDIVYEENNTIYSIDCRGSICIVNDKNRDNEKGDIWLNCDISINKFDSIDKKKIRVIEAS